MTSRTRHFGSLASREYRSRLDQRRRENRALHHWANRPLSPEEAELFARLRAWLELGASLSLACMNAQVSESQFAALVAELEAGRNSEFAVSMRELLAVPWHFGIGQKDSPYIRDHSFSDREILYGLLGRLKGRKKAQTVNDLRSVASDDVKSSGVFLCRPFGNLFLGLHDAPQVRAHPVHHDP